MERAALAAGAFSLIQFHKVSETLGNMVLATEKCLKDDSTAALSGLLQCLRLQNRAIEALARLEQQTHPAASNNASGRSASPNPFDLSSAPSPSPEEKPANRKVYTYDVQWRVAEVNNVLRYWLKTLADT